MSDIAIVWDAPNARGDWEIVPYESEDVTVAVETPVVFGTGDSETLDFQLWLPDVDVIPVVEASIYRTDWQGTQLLYATPRTNELTYSQAFENAIWNGNGITITPAAIVAPDGTLTGEKIADNTTASAAKNMEQGVTGLSTMVPYTHSVHAQAAEYGYLLLRLIASNNTNSYAYAVFNLATGTPGVSGVVGGATGLTTEIEELEDGWYRCSMTAVPDSGGTTTGVSGLIAAQPTNSNGNVRTGVVGSGCYAWGADLKPGTLSGYIPTTTAPVTVTDYVLGPTGQVSMASAPTEGAVLSWTGAYLSRMVSGGYLKTGDDIETALLLSLFTDRLAASDDQIPDGSTDRRGWWGDDADVDSLGPTGSRLWLLSRRVSPTDRTLLDAYDYVAEAIQWMIDTGVVARFDINVQWLKSDALGISITAWPPSGGAPVTYNWAWKGMS